jgi:SAM-dependent methyltransferase
MHDPIGQAIYDYYENGQAPYIIVNTNYTEGETLPPSYFFREFKNMPDIEKKALQLCRGKVLDIGAGAGSHALYLQKKNIDVTAMEKSEMAAKVMEKRGMEKIVKADLYNFSYMAFDTLLVLMNGTGIGGTLDGLKKMLLHLKTLLKSGGQLLIDSSDIKYLFEENDGSFWIDLNSTKYYGEMEYELTYKNLTSTFNWLFVDYKTLHSVCNSCGLKSKLIMEGKHHDYLANITF